MLGKVIDINRTDAFVTFEDGTTMDISISKLPENVKVGQSVNIPLDTSALTNDHFNNIF